MQWQIPDFGDVTINSLVCDYNGTLAINGRLIPGLADQFQMLKQLVQIHVLTADTYGIAAEQLDGLPCELHILPKVNQAEAKRDFVISQNSKECIAVGNGRNDRLMLAEARIGIAVLQEEGLAKDAAFSADILVHSIFDACSLIKNDKRLIATLRS